MKRYFFFLFIFYIFIGSINHVKAQVDRILDLSNAAGSLGRAFDGGTGDACSNGCADGCAEFFLSGCANLLVDDILIGGIDLHKSYINRKDDVPEIISLELMPNFGFNPSGNYLLLPRIRGNWGLFATDFRYNTLIETPTVDGTKFYSTIDWQILCFNFYLSDKVLMRLGSGIMYENANGNTWNESTFGLDLLPNDDKFGGSTEFRIAPSYYKTIPRIEASLNINYTLFKNDHFSGQITTGLLYEQYYSEVNIWGIQTGLKFSIF